MEEVASLTKTDMKSKAWNKMHAEKKNNKSHTTKTPKQNKNPGTNDERKSNQSC